MSEPELREIIQKRASRTVMTFSADAIWTIVILSRGLPYFTQTLSKFAALHAIDNQLLRDNLDENERQSGFEAAVGSEVMIALGPEVCKPFSLAPAF